MKLAPLVTIIPAAVGLLNLMPAKSVLLDTVAQQQHVLNALQVLPVTELHVQTVVLENSLLKAPRSAPHAQAARSKILQLKVVAVNVLLVSPASLSLLALV